MKGDPTQVDAHTPAVGLFALISLENELINSLSLVARYFKVRLQLQLSFVYNYSYLPNLVHAVHRCLRSLFGLKQRSTE